MSTTLALARAEVAKRAAEFISGVATGGSTTQGTGSGLINQVDAFGFPTLRTFTFSISSRF